MKRIVVFLLSGSLFFTGHHCHGLSNVTNADSALIENSVKHIFSDPSSPDTFTIAIYGSSILKGQVQFTITDYRGNRIWYDSFPASGLLGYAFDMSPASTEKMEDYIRQKIAGFFNPDKFLTPAIGKEEKFDPDYSTENIWYEIKANEQSTGFLYNVSGGLQRKIAFSGKRSKTVIYFECC